MDNFAPSMKEKYKDRLVNREKQWLTRHSNKLIRLELVERRKREGSSANVQRRREDNSIKLTPLAYSDLFKAKKGEKPVRKVLVEGDAGIGKTTLSISLSEDWASGLLFQEFELLLLLSLRQKEVASAGSLRELLKLLHSSPRVCESVANYLEDEEAKNVLVIADGWDEFSESEQKEEYFLYQFLFKMFPFMSVIVTSRPSASAPLHSLACIDRFVEVIGFSKDDIKEYIQCEFASDQEKARRLLEQLEYNPLIESVCCVPLNCSIICHLWHTLEEALPSTMTQLYTKLILYVVCRNVRKLEAYGPTFGISSFDDLPESLQQSWWLLCQFACEALEKDDIVFSKKELLQFFPQGDEKILCFGLLQSAETVLDVTCVVSFNFVHLTFMEYLAALYLSRQPLKRWLQFLQKGRFTMVPRFIFGICFSGSKNAMKDLDVKQALLCVDKYNSKHLSLCHCAFEAQNYSINYEVIQILNVKPSLCQFGYPHTAHDCAAVLYVIDNMQECSGLNIDFSNCGISEKQIVTLTNILASKHGKLQVKELNLNGNKLTDKSVSDIFQTASAAFQSLTDLYLSDNRIGAKSIKSITTALAKSTSSMCRLSQLMLSDNPLGVSGLQALENAVSDDQLSNLGLLYLDRSLTSDADTNAAQLTTFVEALLGHCPHLRLLDLSQNNLSVPGASALARIISKLQHRPLIHGKLKIGFKQQPQFLSEIYLNQTSLGDKGLCAFLNNVDGVCHLEELWLIDNGIRAIGVSCLADAVCSGNIVFKSMLHLSNNTLGLEGTLAVGKMLSSNHCQLMAIALSRCELTTAGSRLPNTNHDGLDIDAVRVVGQQFCQMPQNNTITWLILDYNSFTGEGIHILAGFMNLCTLLTSLLSCNCGITSNDFKQLFDKLSQLKCATTSPCSKLEAWYLENNEIDDSGISALMNHIPSRFPRLGCGRFDLKNNPVSSQMEKLLREKLRRRKEFWSSRKSSSDGYSSGEEEPVFEPLPRPHPLTTSQCACVQHECVDGSCGGESATVAPDSEREPALVELQTTVNQSPLQMLDQVLDFESGGVSKHLGQIADSMCEWEGPIAEQLSLTPAEIAAIKMKYPGELILQTRAALEKWKQKLGSSATYCNLIGVFESSGYQRYADTVRNICGGLPTNQPVCNPMPQKCATPASVSKTLSKDSGYVMEKEKSCEQSHDSSESDNEIFFTPPTSPVHVALQHEDRELLAVSSVSQLRPLIHKVVDPSSPA